VDFVTIACFLFLWTYKQNSLERESREAVRDKIVDQCSAVLVEFKPGSSESYLLQLLSGEDRNIFEHERRESPAKRGP